MSVVQPCTVLKLPCRDAFLNHEPPTEPLKYGSKIIAAARLVCGEPRLARDAAWEQKFSSKRTGSLL